MLIISGRGDLPPRSSRTVADEIPERQAFWLTKCDWNYMLCSSWWCCRYCNCPSLSLTDPAWIIICTNFLVFDWILSQLDKYGVAILGWWSLSVIWPFCGLCLGVCWRLVHTIIYDTVLALFLIFWRPHCLEKIVSDDLVTFVAPSLHHEGLPLHVLSLWGGSEAACVQGFQL